MLLPAQQPTSGAKIIISPPAEGIFLYHSRCQSYLPPPLLPKYFHSRNPVPVPSQLYQPIVSHATSSTSLHSIQPLQVMATSTVVPHTFSFIKLLLVFTAGGLFFSSVMAWCTASYAIGRDNMNRLSAMAGVVWENIWMTFTQGLSATKAALLAESDPSTRRKLQWKDAWKVFLEKLRETRLRAVEGVNAMRREAKLYAAAVGPPGLIPLQYMIDRMMPYIIASGLEESLQSALDHMATQANGSGANKATLYSFSAGDESPKLESARVYDLGSNAMAFDFDIAWDSSAEATIHVHAAGGLARLPVTLTNAKFHGPVRVVLTPLIKESPGFGATLMSFPTMPKINFDIRVAGGEVTKIVPRLRAELVSSIEKSISESMIWPKRAVIPSVCMSEKQVISRALLNDLKQNDPLLEAEKKLGTRPMLRRMLNQMTQVLYEDNAAGDQELNSIWELPMPTFESQQSSKHTSNQLSHSFQGTFLWDKLQKTSKHLQEQTVIKLEEAKTKQNAFSDQMYHWYQEFSLHFQKPTTIEREEP